MSFISIQTELLQTLLCFAAIHERDRNIVLLKARSNTFDSDISNTTLNYTGKKEDSPSTCSAVLQKSDDLIVTGRHSRTVYEALKACSNVLDTWFT